MIIKFSNEVILYSVITWETIYENGNMVLDWEWWKYKNMVLQCVPCTEICPGFHNLSLCKNSAW